MVNRDPFVIDGPTCISFSGGRTSAYMLWRVIQSNGGLPDEARVIFANTGKEEEATLRFVRDCGERWGVPITWVEYVPDAPRFRVVDFDSASRQGEPFEALIQARGMVPNPVSRFCTVELKVRTIHRYLRSQEWSEWESWMGIRADEPRRVARLTNNDYGKHETKYSPLAVAGIGVEQVGAFWAANDFDLGLPNMGGKTMHGNCDLCFLKPAAQVFSLIAEKPERAIWWAKMETEVGEVASGNGAYFRVDRPSYAEMLKFSQDQLSMFDPAEQGIPCFCGD
jgi:3'-phosphoadenosine 5'-phosphosulfate sulfotransferase (PAPS reductase)/FAD synthetase